MKSHLASYVCVCVCARVACVCEQAEGSTGELAYLHHGHLVEDGVVLVAAHFRDALERKDVIGRMVQRLHTNNRTRAGNAQGEKNPVFARAVREERDAQRHRKRNALCRRSRTSPCRARRAAQSRRASLCRSSSGAAAAALSRQSCTGCEWQQTANKRQPLFLPTLPFSLPLSPSLPLSLSPSSPLLTPFSFIGKSSSTSELGGGGAPPPPLLLPPRLLDTEPRTQRQPEQSRTDQRRALKVTRKEVCAKSTTW
jgi:hypothetical protein